tara:strand:- start:990 stop:2024 length:1035 start_codon:yes stop_codon:yes gene_type:complete
MGIKITDGKKIAFNKKKIKLLEELLSFLNANSLEDFIQKNTIPYCYKKLYEFTNSLEFKKIYLDIIDIVSKEIKTKNFYYQKIPSFRIHAVGAKSVEYHNDTMYGHGSSVTNIWIPLTETNHENSLWLSDYKKSKQLMKKFKEDKMSIQGTNKVFSELSHPQILSYGEILLFNTATMHGTKTNTSKLNRFSFDFRILEKGKSSGVKVINDLYDSFFEKKVKYKKSIFYMYQKNPLMKNCSHVAQRSIISFYAKKNYFSNIIEETEIYGVDHYPNLIFYITTSKIKDIIMTSILCLPTEKALRVRALKLAKKHKKVLHFALEDVKNNKSTQWINSYYTSVSKNFK